MPSDPIVHAPLGGAFPSSPATTWHDFTEEGFPDPLLDLITERFRLLGEPLRLKLLAALGRGERSVSELVALTGAGQPNVSKHLNALAQGRLVQRRKVGTSIIYTVADSTIFTLCNIVCAGVQERLSIQARLVARWSQATTAAHPKQGEYVMSQPTLSTTEYSFGLTLTVPFAEAITRVTDALKLEGFGVLTTIDVTATLKTKLDVDVAPYTILGACNPTLAHRALTMEPNVGLLLPCNVVVREVPGGVRVEIADPHALLTIVPGDAMQAVADEARAKLQRVAALLQSAP